jgi:hypothetical protein
MINVKKLNLLINVFDAATEEEVQGVLVQH